MTSTGRWKLRGGSVTDRPTVTLLLAKCIYTGMLEDVPEHPGQEVPLHPKRRRSFRDNETVPLSTSVWYQPWPSTSGESHSPPQVRRKLVPSPSKSRKLVVPPLKLYEVDELLNRGSEDDSDDDDTEDDNGIFITARKAREYLGDADAELSVSAEPDFAWPPVISALPPPSPPLSLPPSLPPSPDRASPSTDYGPSDKFHFEWKSFQETQISPEKRREPFSNYSCGPTAAEPYDDPYSAFVAIWDRQIMEHIVLETNRYAQEVVVTMLEVGVLQPTSRISKWRDTTVDEMYVYFGIILAMGIVVKSRHEEYWNKQEDIFSTPEFTSTMSFNRFNLLNKCLHFQNNASLEPQLSNSQAKFAKLKPVIDHVNIKFSSLFNMGRNIALDESLMQWRGWLNINQFIPNKAAKLGIKTYEVCDSKTGYLWRFEFHAGHDSPAPQETTPLSGTVSTIVLRLLHGLEGKGHTIWMDNFYNSPALARELKSLGFDCVGTLRTNRPLVPEELAKLGKSDMRVGQISGCTSGDVDLMVWRDKNRVAIISTYHGLTTTMCNDVKKPSAICDYNICMGGVDKKDQLLSGYPIERTRTRIWYKKFFRRVLNISVLNSYILFKHFHQITHRAFRRDLIRQILAHHLPSHSQPPKTIQRHHIPAQYDLSTDGNRRLRRRCIVCSKRSTTYCEGCDVSLCLFECYKQHHLNQSH